MLLLFLAISGCSSDPIEVPEGKITLLVPWGQSGGTDKAVQAVLPYLGDDFVVTYMPGESGRTGLEAVYKSDKSVIGAGAPKSLTTRAVLGEWELTANDWEIYTIWRVAPLLSASSDISVAQVFKTLRSQDRLSVATAGEGSAGHGAMESLTNADRTIKYNHRQFPEGGKAAVEAAASGQADLTAQLSTEQVDKISSGDLYPLAVFLPEAINIGGDDIPPITDFISEPMPDLSSTFALMVPKNDTAMIQKMNAIWDQVPTDLTVDGVQWKITRGGEARKLIRPEISAAAWSLDRQGKSKVHPQHLGIASPDL